MAHTCCDPDRATQCRAHSVAANSRSFRDVARVSRHSVTPPTVTKETLSYLSCHLPVSVSQGNFLAKTDRATWGCSSYTHTNRATLCHYVLENQAYSGLIGAFPGPIRAFSGPTGTNSSAPHSHGERVEIAPQGPFCWAAANGGVTNGGLRGVWPPFQGNRPTSAFFALLLPFSSVSGGPEQHLENPENGGKRPISSDFLRFA